MLLHGICLLGTSKPQTTVAQQAVATLGGRPSIKQRIKRPKSAIKKNSTLLCTFPSTAFSNLIALVRADLATKVLQRFVVALMWMKQPRLDSASSRFLWQCNALEKSPVRQIGVGRVSATSSTCNHILVCIS